MSLLAIKKRIYFAASMMIFIILFPAFSIAGDPSASKPIPTLLLSGSLEGTPQTVTLCDPLNIQYSIKSIGTATVQKGQLLIEIKSAATGQLVFTQQLGYTTRPGLFKIKNVNLPPGEHTITLKASAWNWEHKLSRDFTLAEQNLTVSAPVLVKKSHGTIPRVLLWLNRNATPVQQAFAEMIVKQAFEEDEVYYTTVDRQEDFTNGAMSGGFSTLVLFENDELLERTDWLMDRLSLGQGLVIIGSEDRTRMIAETFGFKFREAPSKSGALLLLTDDSAMGLSGTIPVSGRILQPQKKGASVAALFAGDKKPAMLIDKVGNGRVIVMPFSFTRSALDTGLPSLYSMLLRTAVRIATPENDEQSGVSTIQLVVSTSSDPINVRIIETLPAGTKVIWMNGEGSATNNTIRYDLAVDKEPQTLLYIYQVPAGNKTPASTEVFLECNEKLVSQGKIE